VPGHPLLLFGCTQTYPDNRNKQPHRRQLVRPELSEA
jgi:hypothetical protein